MVRPKFSILLVVVFVSAALQGCSLKKFWGEPASSTGIIEMPASTSECGPLGRILEANDEDSKAALECWAGTLEQLWTRIAGTERDVLSNDEITVLVQKGILSFGGGIESDQAKLDAIRHLLGLGSSLKRSELDSWIEIFRSKRVDLRTLYERRQLRKKGVLKFQYADLILAANTLRPLLQKMNWRMTSAELSADLLRIIDPKDVEVRRVFEPSAALAISFLNSICPTFTRKEIWNTAELGACFVKMTEQFSDGAPWFEFVFDPVENTGPVRIDQAKQALQQVSPRIEAWFADSSLVPFPVRRVLDLSQAMGVNTPDQLIESLEVLRRFDENSGGDYLHPKLFGRVFRIFKAFESELLDSVGPFIDAQLRGRCVNRDAADWSSCILDSRSTERLNSFSLRRALQIKNLHYGTRVDPFNGSRFLWIIFYDTLAGQMIDVFAGTDSDGKKETVIRSQLGDSDDPVVQLISTGLESYETVHGFIVNIQRKLKGLPFIDGSTLQKLRALNPKGLSRLVTMTNQLLVQRSFDERNAFEKAASMLTNLAPESPVFLDQLALTAVLNLVDSLGLYKDSYLKRLELVDSRSMRRAAKPDESSGASPEGFDDTLEYLVSREEYRRALPRILAENFPRTYLSCQEFDFESSCAIAFDQVLPEVEGKKGYIHFDDLDIVTIMAAAAEGLMDSCDQSGDSRLSWSLWDGDDELDCAYVGIKDVTKRLLQAQIISASKTEKAGVSFFLNFINANVLTRAMGKAALMRGTTSNMLVNWPLFWRNKSASIGSIYGLVADVMDHKQVKVIRKKAKAAHAEEPDSSN